MPTAIASDPTSAVSRIPPALSVFVGRRRELDEIGALLDGHRLITLTGAAGSGKTRLASELARVRSELHEVLWIELGPLADGSLVAGQLAAMLGIRQPT